MSNTPGLIHTTWLLVILLIILTTTSNTSLAVNCPSGCRCSWVLDSLEVDCSRSGLVEYPNFENIPIEHLNLADNFFVEFPTQLNTIDSLIYLDLSNNRIEFIDSNDLLGFISLRTLILANNSIASWQSINPSEAFKHAISLKRLSLSGNKLSSFTDEQIAHTLISESLNQLELSDCSITTAGGDHLMNGLPNLDRLILSGNEITSLTALPSRTLRVLELSNCSLQRLNSFLLAGLPNLEALNLSWNPSLQFGSKPIDIIYSATLSELDVSRCNLDAINLSGLPRLANLRLRGNMLRSVTGSTFANNSLLEVLDLAQNSLRFVDADSFGKLKRLTKLDLSYNEIARLDRNLFRSNDALVNLNLSRNVIEKFTKLISNSLREISLSWCEIVSIDSIALSGLTSIQRLDLSNNLIREIPGGMRSETLQMLNLSNCRLSALRNTTFQGFPELASLWLNGNRFTNPFPIDYFRSNKFLDRIWVGDNPWICHCQDKTFMEFYDFLTAKPQKLKDKSNVRCASPANYYGKAWEAACVGIWIPNGHTTSAEKVWTMIMIIIGAIVGLFFLYTCIKKLIKTRKERMDLSEYQQNQDEMQEIRRQNARMLQEEGRPNAPNPYETNLPSYEDALLMPKLDRTVKSMVDLTASYRSRKQIKRTCTDPEVDIPEVQEINEELILDNCHRFRSEEMLSNRAKERTAPVGTFRRIGRVDHNNSASRLPSNEDSRFAASSFKTQNMQSAEKIGNFQSYENSPYTKRRAKIAEIPPFKRATLKADSIEFLTDPEFEESSKPSSPFSRRKPKGSTSQSRTSGNSSKSSRQGSATNVVLDAGARLDPAIEDYFGTSAKAHSTDGSEFHLVIEHDVASLPEVDSSSSDGKKDLEQGRRKKRRNSISRRASGSFSAAAAAAADETSSSDREPVVVVHKPMRETLF